MPKQTQSVSLTQLLGPLAGQAAKAHAAHASDTTTFGMGTDLPPGIEGGVAQLVECQFGRYKSGKLEGKPFWRAAGIVVSPVVLNGVKLEGRRTQIGPEPLCDTPEAEGKRKTFDDHWAHMLNELRKLGLVTQGTDLVALERGCAALETARPYFKFRTWQGDPTPKYPNPKVNEEWRGACQFIPGQNGQAGGVRDSSSPVTDRVEENAPEPEAPTGGDESSGTVDTMSLTELGAAADAGDQDACQRITALATKAGILETVEGAESWSAGAALLEQHGSGGSSGGKKPAASAGASGDDVAALGTAADAGDQDSVDKLDALARAAGLNPDEIPSWGEVAQALLGKGDTQVEVFVPVKGKTCYYRPPKAKKPAECEITAVFKETCNLKNLDTQQSYKSVPHDQLVAID